VHGGLPVGKRETDHRGAAVRGKGDGEVLGTQLVKRAKSAGIFCSRPFRKGGPGQASIRKPRIHNHNKRMRRFSERRTKGAEQVERIASFMAVHKGNPKKQWISREWAGGQRDLEKKNIELRLRLTKERAKRHAKRRARRGERKTSSQGSRFETLFLSVGSVRNSISKLTKKRFYDEAASNVKNRVSSLSARRT